MSDFEDCKFAKKSCPFIKQISSISGTLLLLILAVFSWFHLRVQATEASDETIKKEIKAFRTEIRSVITSEAKERSQMQTDLAVTRRQTEEIGRNVDMLVNKFVDVALLYKYKKGE